MDSKADHWVCSHQIVVQGSRSDWGAEILDPQDYSFDDINGYLCKCDQKKHMHKASIYLHRAAKLRWTQKCAAIMLFWYCKIIAGLESAWGDAGANSCLWKKIWKRRKTAIEASEIRKCCLWDQKLVSIWCCISCASRARVRDALSKLAMA